MIFTVITSEIVFDIRPSSSNPRNSEGDFIRLADGRIMFAFSRYTSDSHDNAPCDIAAVFSTDNGDSFSSSPVILARASEHGMSNIMSVSLLRMQNGDVGLFYIVKNNSDGTSSYVLRRSSDECKSFGAPITCLPDKFSGYYVINNCRVLRTCDNRLIIPAALHRCGIGKDGVIYSEYYGVCHLFSSSDDGFSWQEMPCRFVLPDNGASRTGLQEPGIIELDRGVLYAYFRSDRMFQYESFSPDGGTSWSAVCPSHFTSPDSPMKISKNPYSGKYYAVWNPVPNYNGRLNASERFINAGRTPLVLAESQDGLTFGSPVAIESDESRGFCYPAIFFIDKATALLSYCSGGADDGMCLTRTTIRKITLD